MVQIPYGQREAARRLLPPLILVKADQPQTLALRTTVNMLASEMAEPTPGSDLVVNRLADVLFIQKAAALLQKGDRKLIDVARSVGYDSDAAFSKAFKRVVSVTPRDFRRRSQGCVGK